ncbi:hypothetical protein PRIPAC_72201, partial [Pristionchus pacificus]|uniref:Uncharacterized protein n=1 Tax=Pristionchus pacificus TaxID=54126 RepID=A0A2A6C743_PRIPA
MATFRTFRTLNHLQLQPAMNTIIIFSCCLLALAMASICYSIIDATYAGPDLTPQQQAQYDSLKAQSLTRLSPAGQQAQIMMDQLDQQMQMRTIIGINNYSNNNGMGYFR